MADIMVDWKRFQTPVFILGCAAVMYYVGSKQSYSNTRWLIQTCSLPLGAIGLWSLATVLGKPPQKMDMVAVVQDTSNPQHVSHIPMVVQEDSTSQGVGAWLITLSLIGIVVYLLLQGIYIVRAVVGGGIYMSNSGEWTEMETLLRLVCYGTVLTFLASLVALARPWSVLMSDDNEVIHQQSVSVTQTNVVQDPPSIVIEESTGSQVPSED